MQSIDKYGCPYWNMSDGINPNIPIIANVIPTTFTKFAQLNVSAHLISRHRRGVFGSAITFLQKQKFVCVWGQSLIPTNQTLSEPAICSRKQLLFTVVFCFFEQQKANISFLA
jgi:hypothetical protein